MEIEEFRMVRLRFSRFLQNWRIGERSGKNRSREDRLRIDSNCYISRSTDGTKDAVTD